jgi:hypothetical protein
MPKEIREVVNSYLIISLEEFSKLIDGGVPEGFRVQLEQIGEGGFHGPRMCLSDTSHLKVTLIDDSKKTAFQMIREFQEEKHDLVTVEREDGTVIVKNRGE